MIRGRVCTAAAEETPKKQPQNHLYIRSDINSFHYHSLTPLRFPFAVSSNIVKGNRAGVRRGWRGRRRWGWAGATPNPLCSPNPSVSPRAVPRMGHFEAKITREGGAWGRAGKMHRGVARAGKKKTTGRKELKELRLLSLSKGQGR